MASFKKLSTTHRPLLSVCRLNIENVALKLLDFDDIDYNKIDEFGDIALTYACEYNMKKLALKLLEKENINYNQINYDGDTALILACKK